MAFHSSKERTPLCPSIIACNLATLLMADLHPVGGPEIWSGNQISTSIATRIPIDFDEEGCPSEIQSFPQATHLLGKLSPLWEHGIHNWFQVLCRGPDGHPYFLDERELQWANPNMQFPLPAALTRALQYLRILLSSTDHAQWSSIRHKLALQKRLAYSVAPRWRAILNPDWDSLLERPSPLALERATKQLSIESALLNWAATRASTRVAHHTRIMLNIPTKKKKGTSHRYNSAKRRRTTTVEPLRGSGAPGDKASIQRILARSEPIRVRHGRYKTWVEEYLVQWGPEYCTFGEALKLYYMGFDIESISSLEGSTLS